MIVQPVNYGKICDIDKHKLYMQLYECQLNQKYNMKDLVGGPLLVGGLGPGPPAPPLPP